VDQETFQRLAQHYSEREICEIVWLVASEHLYNMTNIGLNIHSEYAVRYRQREMARCRGVFNVAGTLRVPFAAHGECGLLCGTKNVLPRPSLQVSRAALALG